MTSPNRQRDKHEAQMTDDALAAFPELKNALENAANGFASLAHNLRQQSGDDVYGTWFVTMAAMAESAEEQARATLSKL